MVTITYNNFDSDVMYVLFLWYMIHNAIDMQYSKALLERSISCDNALADDKALRAE